MGEGIVCTGLPCCKTRLSAGLLVVVRDLTLISRPQHCLACKHLQACQDRGVCGASRSHLSSYALTLMAIYFMQAPSLRATPLCFRCWVYPYGPYVPSEVHPKISLPMLPPQAFKAGILGGVHVPQSQHKEKKTRTTATSTSGPRWRRAPCKHLVVP